MSDMVERVARAMFEASIAMCDAQNMPPEALNWDEIPEKLPQDSRPMWLSFARAAIAAMREPTPGMVEAAPRMTGADGQEYLMGLVPVWNAMIDAALREGGK